MDSRYIDNLIDDDEVPELMEDDFARMIPFDQLPEAEKRCCGESWRATSSFAQIR